MRLMLSDARIDGPSVLALGMFDGVHAGHAWLLRAAREWGSLEGLPVVVCTFSRHPLALLRPGEAPPMLSTVPERASRMAFLKADALAVLPFDEDMRDLPPQDFVKMLTRRFSPRHVVVGFNYTFGAGGGGDARLLKKLGRVFGFEVHVVSPVQVDGHVVSSSRVRRVLAQGDVEQAARLMERPYAITGSVVHGKGIGRTMGFPTANVKIPEGKALPAFGIYVARARMKEGRYQTVLSLGVHPTLPEGGVTLEAHLLSGPQDLYGRKMRIEFLKRLRDEIKFDSIQALKDQIAKDVRDAKAHFAKP